LAGSSLRTGSGSCRSQARRTIQSGGDAVVGKVAAPWAASSTALPSDEPMTTPRAKPNCRTRPSRTSLACWTGSPTSSSRAPISTIDCRSSRRCRSSRSFIAEKSDVARANSQKEVTLSTGIRSNSIARPGTTSIAGSSSAAWA
jgi:hypothetical protein